MEILYQRKMQRNGTIKGRRNEGVAEHTIAAIEVEIGYSFPRSVREFIFLGGQQPNMIRESGIDSAMFGNNGEPYWKDLQELTRENMLEDDLLPEKRFWVFSSLDGGEQSNFIYFDDGEDPEVWLYSVLAPPDFEPGIVSMKKKFSEFIDSLIRYESRFSF